MEKKEDNFDFVEDPRFKVCLKEMKMCFVFYIAFFVCVMAATYGLGHQLVLGFPLWFLVAGIILPAVFCVIAYILTHKVFEDTDLDPYID